MKVAAALAAAALVASGGACAQDSEQGLSDIQAVRLLVEDIDDDAKVCGITREALDTAMRLPLASSKLKVFKPGDTNGTYSPYLYVQIVAVRPHAICAVYIHLSMRRAVFLGGAASSPVKMISAPVWSTGYMLSDTTVNTARRVTDKVEDMTKLFIGAWLRSN